MEALSQLWKQHGVLLIPLFWMGLSLILNGLLAMKSPEDWVAYAEKNPKSALIINIIVRATGIDIVSIVQHVQTFVAQKAEDSKAKKEDPK